MHKHQQSVALFISFKRRCNKTFWKNQAMRFKEARTNKTEIGSLTVAFL